jgi:hypothetical protein
MTSEILNKINQVFDDHIQIHHDLCNIHISKIKELQTHRNALIEDTGSELNVLERTTDFINKNNDTDEIRLCEQLQYNQNTLTSDSLGNDQDVLYQHKKDALMSVELNDQNTLIEDGMSGQDQIWNRIRQSQLDNEKRELVECKTVVKMPDDEMSLLRNRISTARLPYVPEHEKLDAQQKEEKIHKLIRSDNLYVDKQLDTRSKIIPDLKKKATQVNPPMVNALFRINPSQRKALLKKMFIKANENISNLAKLDNTYINNFDKEVQAEADRLLKVYLSTH